MKPLKYTVAALAILAAASFSSSAMAASTGDLILGLDNSSTSLEFDLGAFGNLTPGETFNLGTNIESTLGNGSLSWDIAASGLTVGAQSGGLNAKEEVFTAANLITPLTTTNPSATYNNIQNETNGFSGGTAVATGTNWTAVSLANTASTSFFAELAANSGNYGWTSSAGTFAGSFPDTTDTFTLYDKKSGAGTSAVALGTFEFSVVNGNDILTYAAPEPSAYALGLCAVALFFVLRRRSTVA